MPQAGWYDDGSGQRRWWDGTQWTDQPADTATAQAVSGPLYSFTSHIAGKNAAVAVYEDRVEWNRSGAGLSAGKITAGVFTGGASLLVTGVGKGGYTTKAGRGSESIPMRAITSVATKRDGAINTIVAIGSSSGVVEMRVHHNEAEHIRKLLNDLMNRAHAAPAVVVQVAAPVAPTPSTSDHTEQLLKLADLHKAGVLTDEEFAAKKTEILARM